MFSDGYQPFGQDNGSAQCSGSCEPVKFTGKPYSPSTGLYYEYQRWYDNNTGRFLSQDPLPGQLGNAQSLNQYSYVLNRPTSLTDPSGASFLWQGCGGGERCGWASTLAGAGFTPGNTPQLDSALTGEYVTPAQATTSITDTNYDTGLGNPQELGKVEQEQESQITGTASGPEDANGQARPWQPGDPPNAPTREGKYPSWTTVRGRVWKNLALTDSETYGSINPENPARMETGRSALDETGRPFEIHHIGGRDIADPHNLENLEVLRWWQHYFIHYGK